MKIKTFTGKSYKEALDLVKKEFGLDAVILETEEIKGEESHVKITAAIDFESNGNVAESVSVKNNFKSFLEEEVYDDTGFSTINFLREELKDIKDMLLELKSKNKFTDSDGLCSLLKKKGIKDEFIEELVYGIKDENELYNKMVSEFKTGYRITNGKTIMLVGPTGVGKTTTIVKLASFAVKIGKKVGIINLDSFRLGAFEQMRVFCQLLGIPFCSINDTEDFYEFYINFSENKDIIFIDTTGRNPKDRKYINELSKIKNKGIPLEIHLTASLSMHDEVFIKSKENYEELGIDYLIFTKLDEAYNFGGLYNIYKVFGKPIAYITNGQKIPNDIQAVNSTKLTNIILGRGLVQ